MNKEKIKIDDKLNYSIIIIILSLIILLGSVFLWTEDIGLGGLSKVVIN